MQRPDTFMSHSYYRQMRLGLLIAMWMAIQACADSHQVTRLSKRPPVKLNPNGAVLVAVPEDAVYGSNVYRGSGRTTAQTITAVFARHARSVRMEAKYVPPDDSIAAAQSNGYTYLVIPMILHWEDRATEWSGSPDKIEVKIEVIDVASNRTLEAFVVTGKSGLGTMGGDRPQDLLRKPVEQSISEIY
jgi:hypothetical protein